MFFIRFNFPINNLLFNFLANKEVRQLNNDLELFKKNIAGNAGMKKTNLNGRKVIIFYYLKFIKFKVQERLIEYGELVKFKNTERKMEQIKVTDFKYNKIFYFRK